jgi:hypothetical protein
VSNAFYALQQFTGDLILENPAPGPEPVPDFAPPYVPLRVYLTQQTNGVNAVNLWGLNFSEDQRESVSFVLTNLPFKVGQVIRRSFGKPGAANSLTNSVGLGWTVQDVTASVNPTDFTFTVEAASFAILSFAPAGATNSSAPTFQSIRPSGTSLVLGGSNGIEGTAYSVLTSTNLDLPLINWTPVQTNVFGPGGSFSTQVPLNPAARATFYRLQSQAMANTPGSSTAGWRSSPGR